MRFSVELPKFRREGAAPEDAMSMAGERLTSREKIRAGTDSLTVAVR